MPSLTQDFTVARPLAQVWAALRDVESVVACLPGASLDGPPGADGTIKGALRVKLGPIAASFGGQGRVQYDDVAKTGLLEGGGADRGSGSRAKGTARFAAVGAGPDATRVTVTVDYALSGTLAQFARGSIIDGIARRMVDAFTENLEGRLAPDEPVTDRDATPERPQAAAFPGIGRVLQRLWARLLEALNFPVRNP